MRTSISDLLVSARLSERCESITACASAGVLGSTRLFSPASGLALPAHQRASRDRLCSESEQEPEGAREDRAPDRSLEPEPTRPEASWLGLSPQGAAVVTTSSGGFVPSRLE